MLSVNMFSQLHSILELWHWKSCVCTIFLFSNRKGPGIGTTNNKILKCFHWLQPHLYPNANQFKLHPDTSDKMKHNTLLKTSPWLWEYNLSVSAWNKKYWSIWSLPSLSVSSFLLPCHSNGKLWVTHAVSHFC